VGNLSVASQQIVEICKALVTDPKVIIMDEPTSSLTEKEVVQLYKIIEELRSRGVTIIYVSHNLPKFLKSVTLLPSYVTGNISTQSSLLKPTLTGLSR